MLYFFKYAFTLITSKIRYLVNKDSKIFAFNIWSNILSSSLYDTLKLSKTTYSQKLFWSDCMRPLLRIQFCCILIHIRSHILILNKTNFFEKCFSDLNLMQSVGSEYYFYTYALTFLNPFSGSI